MLDHNLFRYLPESRKVNHPVPGVDDHPTRRNQLRSVFLRLCSWLFDNLLPSRKKTVIWYYTMAAIGDANPGTAGAPRGACCCAGRCPSGRGLEFILEQQQQCACSSCVPCASWQGELELQLGLEDKEAQARFGRHAFRPACFRLRLSFLT